MIEGAADGLEAAERPRARRVEALALPALLAFTLGYRLWARGRGAPLGGFDERLYVQFAQAFGLGGLPALRDLLARYPTDPVLHHGPLPLRLLWVWASALACRLADRCDASALAGLSWIAGLATVPVAWLLFRRWLPPAPAFLGGLLVAVSPLATDLSQRALQDSFFTFWVVASVLFLERSRDGGLADRLALAGCVLAALLSKELMVLLLPLLAVALGRPTARVWRTLLALALAALAAFAVLAVAAGGVSNLLHVYAEYGRSEASQPYTDQFQRGPWFRYLVDLLLVSPATLLAALAGLSLGGLDEALRPGLRRAALFGAGGLAIFSVQPSLNVRFVLFADVLLRALAAAGVFALAGRAPPGWRSRLVALNAALLLGVEVVQFHRLFDVGRIYDPVTAELIQADGMVRWR